MANGAQKHERDLTFVRKIGVHIQTTCFTGGVFPGKDYLGLIQ